MVGFKMFGHDGATYRVAALGSNAYDISSKIEFIGPPIGMRMLFKDAPGNGGTWDPRSDTVFAMQVIVDGCACDFSFYLGDQGPRDMNTDSVSGTPDSQIVINQDNFITMLYGQDCGKTTIKLDPEFAFLGKSTNLATGDHTITLKSLENQIGLYDITVILQSDDDFSLMEPIEYEFKVFIHPCILDDVIITPPEATVITIGEPEQVRPYSWVQQPDCQYPIEVFFTTNLNPPPTYMKHEVDNEQVVFPETQDVSFAGNYPNAEMGVRVYIPEDYTYDIVDITNYRSTFSIEIIDPCPNSEIVPFNIPDEQVRVFVDFKEQTLVTPQDTVSLTYTADGINFCGPRVYKFEVPSLPNQKVVFFDPDTMKITFQSNDLAEVGTHDVYATVALENYTKVRLQVKFELTILACKIETFESVA